MALQDTLLWEEVKEVLSDKEPIRHYYWSATVHAGDKEVVPFRLLSLEVDRQYGKNVADVLILELAMTAGQFHHDLFKNKDDLTLTFKRTPVSSMNNAAPPEDAILMETVRAILITTASEVMAPSREGASDRDVQDTTGIVTVRMQLLDMALEQLMSKTVSLVATRSRAGGVARWILTNLSKDIEVKDEYAIQGVKMQEMDNEERSTVVVRDKTKFLDAPTMLHEQYGGIYSAGFSCYLQAHYWYMYARYDVTKFKDGRPTLTLISVPENKLPSVEKTYRMQGQDLIVLITGGLRYHDNSEAMQFNHGNGTSFTDSRNMMEAFGEVEGNKLKIDRSLNNTAYVGETKKSGNNNVQVGRSRITSNPFVESGLVAERQGSYLQGIWQHSDHTLLFPGMQVKYLYLKDNQVQEAFGILEAAQTFVEPTEQGLTFTRHASNTALTVFLGSKLNWSEVDKETG